MNAQNERNIHMLTVEQHFEKLVKVLPVFEQRLKNSKLTPEFVEKAQKQLDSLDQRYGPSLTAEQLSQLYELQALIHCSKGDLKAANNFANEIVRTNPTYRFVTATAYSMVNAAVPVNPAEPLFFTVSTARYFWLSVVTWGFYDRYWQYKNYRALDNYESRGHQAFLCSLFAPICSGILLSKQLEYAKSKGYTKSYSPVGWAILYFVLNIFGILQFLALLPGMKAARFYNQQIGAPINRKGFYGGEIAWMVGGIVFSALVVLGGSIGLLSSSYTYKISRSDYISNCSSGALEANPDITSGQAKSYCGCVYDLGIITYGEEKFNQLNNDAGMNGVLPSELQELTTECSSKI